MILTEPQFSPPSFARYGMRFIAHIAGVDVYKYEPSQALFYCCKPNKNGLVHGWYYTVGLSTSGKHKAVLAFINGYHALTQ